MNGVKNEKPINVTEQKNLEQINFIQQESDKIQIPSSRRWDHLNEKKNREHKGSSEDSLDEVPAGS